MGLDVDRLDVMRLYTRIVDRRSFTVAAQDLEVPRSTATQVIKELEARLGVRLLQRTTRSVRSTLDGALTTSVVSRFWGKLRKPNPPFGTRNRMDCCESMCMARWPGTLYCLDYPPSSLSTRIFSC